MLEPWDIAAVLAASVAIEAATPGKPATVSSWMGSGGLSLADFILSVPYLAKALGDALTQPPCRRVVRVLETAEQVRSSGIIGKNTVTGYVVLIAPLTPILEKLARAGVDAVATYWGMVEECLRGLPAGELVKAVSAGGVRHLQGFVSRAGASSLWDEYIISSLYDINCWEVISGYKATREASGSMPCDTPPYEFVRNTFLRLINEIVDTSVLKPLGAGWWLAVKEAAVMGREDVLRTAGVNLGSIADLTALATAFWVIRCARSHR